MSVAHGLRAFRAASIAELRRIGRVPSFVVPTIVFPILFFAMFGLPNAGQRVNGVDLGAYILAAYGAYAMLAIALTSFAVSIAQERGLGWNRLLRVTPIPTAAYLGAKLATALITGIVALAVLFAFGALTADVTLPLARWGALVLVLLVGMLPFALLGLALGYSVGPVSAAPVANLVFLPLSFASGLLVPLGMLPAIVREIAPYLPAYHLGQLGWTVIGAGDGTGLGRHVLWLVAYGALFALLAFVAWRRDEGRVFD